MADTVTGYTVNIDGHSVYISADSIKDGDLTQTVVNANITGSIGLLSSLATSAKTNIVEAINEIVNGEGLGFVIVDVLPESPQPKIVYLLRKSNPVTGSKFVDWIYIDGAWETLGPVEVDMSLYYTKSEADDIFLNIDGSTLMSLGYVPEYDLAIVNKGYVDTNFINKDGSVVMGSEYSPTQAKSVVPKDYVDTNFIKKDGTVLLDNAYVPTQDKSVVPKDYVDTMIGSLNTALDILINGGSV